MNQNRPTSSLLPECENRDVPEANEYRTRVDTARDVAKEKAYYSEFAASDRQVGGGHYKNFKIQPAEFITANKLGFLEGCVIKRMCRYEDKNNKEDLLKAIHEIELLIEYKYGD